MGNQKEERCALAAGSHWLREAKNIGFLDF